MSGEHWPQASCDITGSPDLACSCGWATGTGTDWYQHLDAAGWAVAPKADAEDGRALRELREALPEDYWFEVGNAVPERGCYVEVKRDATPGDFPDEEDGEGLVRVVHHFAPTIAAAADAARLALGDGR